MNKIISSIHGNLCGDGSVYLYKEARTLKDINRYNRKNPIRIRYGITYTNNHRELIHIFKNNFKKLFPDIKFDWSRQNEIKIRNKKIVKFFLNFGEYGSNKWRIPNNIKNGSKSIKVAWLRSFFDDEATITGRRIIVSSINKEGVQEISSLLDSLKIKNRFVHYLTKSNIVVYDIKRYYKLIGFNHRLKLNKLKRIINIF
ncbi:hypothetical protein HYX15_02745 [Candidatus Woesearchaeota archaeon]|nr:hypothetical protein [Candidatus Woesearchaeota archaeon]